jgi:glycosyltransferase involved in cell wall biosynthesis
MKMIKEGGFIHKQFLKKEKKLYEISDTIGCMSLANVQFLLKHNPEINPQKVEVNPNTIEPISFNHSIKERHDIRNKYEIPLNKVVFVYGGNLGKPQGLGFLIETIEKTDIENAFFLIVGDGTEFSKVKIWFDFYKPKNAKILQRLPKEDYDRLLLACDIGLIFLNKNFLIPNFPSRLLSYLEMKMPVIAATDANTDIGDIIENANCGYKVLSGDHEGMQSKINKLVYNNNLKELGDNAESLLLCEYTVDISYNLILKKF